jgi:hypothetical protein
MPVNRQEGVSRSHGGEAVPLVEKIDSGARCRHIPLPMKTTRVLATMLALFLAPCGIAFAAEAAPEAATPTASLDTAIPYAIKLLEAKDYKTFLKAFVPPDMYTKVIADKGEDAFVQQFADKKAERLLGVLQKIKDVKPALEDDGKTAVFQLPEEIAGKKTIQFIHVGNAWYIRG